MGPEVSPSLSVRFNVVVQERACGLALGLRLPGPAPVDRRCRGVALPCQPLVKKSFFFQLWYPKRDARFMFGMPMPAGH
jgi:hypothetical protein